MLMEGAAEGEQRERGRRGRGGGMEREWESGEKWETAEQVKRGGGKGNCKWKGASKGRQRQKLTCALNGMGREEKGKGDWRKGKQRNR